MGEQGIFSNYFQRTRNSLDCNPPSPTREGLFTGSYELNLLLLRRQGALFVLCHLVSFSQTESAQRYCPLRPYLYPVFCKITTPKCFHLKIRGCKRNHAQGPDSVHSLQFLAAFLHVHISKFPLLGDSTLSSEAHFIVFYEH